ncbi:MAG TPA: ornithine cyclodeaminase family protein, partial [Acidimicrobiales bacterium]|nr:ornithine cyclodeaminase family protein [Acidimicrobiales bacterium]
MNLITGSSGRQRWLDADEVRECLPMRDAIDAMRLAFGDDRQVPPRVALGASLFMTGRVGGHTGIKVVSTVPGNPAGLVAVFRPDGDPVGVVDGPTLTAIRTGAGAGLATSLLARDDARVLAMLGAGTMAPDQVAAVRAVRPIDRTLVWSRSRDRAEALAGRVDAEAVESADDAVAAADVVTTATPSTRPLFDAAAVRPGTHVNAIGAFTPSMAELPPALLHDAWVVVEDREAAREEAGDLLQAGRDPDAEMSDLLSGRTGPPPGATTVFKSTGIATMDVA